MNPHLQVVVVALIRIKTLALATGPVTIALLQSQSNRRETVRARTQCRTSIHLATLETVASVGGGCRAIQRRAGTIIDRYLATRVGSVELDR